MGAAFGWGLLAGSSLILGGLIALRIPISKLALGLIMAFGSGVLISAVAYDLVLEGYTTMAGAGGAFLDGASGRTIAFGDAFAGGAILTMLADTMMPEAFDHGGKLVGLVTTLGFLTAFFLTTLE